LSKNIPSSYSFKFLSIATFAVILFTQILICIQFPIYTDEICNLIANTRFFHDGPFRIAIIPDCQPGAPAANIPLTLIPGYIINSAIFHWIDSALKLKVFGILQFLIWLLLINSLMKCLNKDSSLSQRVSLLTLPLTGLFPLLLTMNRQAPTIALLLTSSILFFIKKSKISKIACLTGPFWLILIHPKTIFLMPLYYYMACKTYTYKVTKTLFFLASFKASYDIYYFNKAILNCSKNEKMHTLARSANQLSSISDILNSPIDFAKNALLNLIVNISGFCANLLNHDWSGIYKYLNVDISIFKIAHLLVLFLLFYLSFSKIFKSIFLKNNHNSNKTLSHLLTVSILGYFITQNMHFFYNNAYVFHVFYLSTLLILNSSKIKFFQISLFINNSLFLLLCLFCLTNPKILTIHSSWRSMIPKIAGYAFSSSLVGTEENKKIIKTAKQCDLDIKQRLLVDESTYFALKKSKEPVLNRYAWESLREEKPNLNKIRELGIFNGFIARCDFIPKEIRKESTRYGEYCCKSF